MATIQGYLTGNKGVKTNVADSLRGTDVLFQAVNVNMIKRGVITNRYSGWRRQRDGAFNAGESFLDFAIFTGTNGSQTLMFQVGAKLFSYDGATETQVNTVFNAALDVSFPPCMRMFAPYTTGTPWLIHCNGVDQPGKADGTGAGALVALQLNGANYPTATAAPLAVKTYGKFRFAEPFLDRMVYAGSQQGATVAYDILITNTGTFETLTQAAPLLETDGVIFTANPGLGEITGLKAFKLTNENNAMVLLIAQERGVSVITGDTTSTFSYIQLTDEYGIPSNRTWVKIMNDLYFLATDGIRRFSTLVANANLLNASITFDIQDVMNRITGASARWSHATHVRQYQEVQFWVPIDAASHCGNAIIVNYNNGSDAPETVIPVFFLKEGTTVACSISFKGLFYGGGYDGLLQSHYVADCHLYDTTPVVSTVLYSLIEAEDMESYIEELIATFRSEGGRQKFFANAYYSAHMAATLDPPVSSTHVTVWAQPNNWLIDSGEQSGTRLGSWQLGIDSFPEEIPKYHIFKPIGIGRNWLLGAVASQSDHQFDLLGVKYHAETMDGES